MGVMDYNKITRNVRRQASGVVSLATGMDTGAVELGVDIGLLLTPQDPLIEGASGVKLVADGFASLLVTFADKAFNYHITPERRHWNESPERFRD
jgi:hypothetical protein